MFYQKLLILLPFIVMSLHKVRNISNLISLLSGEKNMIVLIGLINIVRQWRT